MICRTIKTRLGLVSERGALIPASSPSLSHWLQAQRAGHRNGWACRRFSAAQMARAVSGPTAIMGGTLTSGHDSIRQVSFAPAPSPQHLWTAWRNEVVAILEPGQVCASLFSYSSPFPSQVSYLQQEDASRLIIYIKYTRFNDIAPSSEHVIVIQL